MSKRRFEGKVDFVTVVKSLLRELKGYSCAIEGKDLFINIPVSKSENTLYSYISEGLIGLCLEALYELGHDVRIWVFGDGLYKLAYVNEKCSLNKVAILTKEGIDKPTAYRGYCEGICFEISGVDVTDKKSLCRDVICLKTSCPCFLTEYGSLLLDKRERGRLYVDGIYSTELVKLKYGFNCKDGFVVKDILGGLSDIQRAYFELEL